MEYLRNEGTIIRVLVVIVTLTLLSSSTTFTNKYPYPPQFLRDFFLGGVEVGSIGISNRYYCIC